MKNIIIIVILVAVVVIVFFVVKQYISTYAASVFKLYKNVDIYVVSDIHYMTEKFSTDEEAYRIYINSGDKLLQYTNVFLDILREEAVKNKPDIMVFTGDLTSNGSKINHEELSMKLKDIELSGTKIYVVPGNHDIDNQRAVCFEENEVHSAENITKEEFVQIYSQFGYEEAASKDEDSLSYLVKPEKNLWLLMLDSTKDYPKMGGYLNDNTLNWIEECSNMAKIENAKIIAVMHHSLINHSELINEDYTVDNNTRVLNVMHKCNIEIVLTGHIHVQDIKSHKSSETGTTVYDISTSSLAVYPHQYGKLSYSMSEGYKYETMKLDVEEYALKNNINDKNLITFENYSESFFTEKCCKKHRTSIFRLLELTDQEKGKIINTISEMNKMFFAGYRNESLNALTQTEGFKLLENVEPCFVKEYVMEMLHDEMANNNILAVPAVSP